MLPINPGNVHAGLASASSRNEILIRDAGGSLRLPGRAQWGGAEALKRLEAWNREFGHVRRRIEKVFGTCKLSYGLRPMRWIGLAKAGLQVRLTAIAFNLKRTRNILRERAAFGRDTCVRYSPMRLETVCRNPKSRYAAEWQTPQR